MRLKAPFEVWQTKEGFTVRSVWTAKVLVRKFKLVGFLWWRDWVEDGYATQNWSEKTLTQTISWAELTYYHVTHYFKCFNQVQRDRT